MTFFPDTAYLVSESSSVKFYIGRSGLHAIKARRGAARNTPLTAKSSLQSDVMDKHWLLCFAHEGMTRDSAKAAGITLMGGWKNA